MKDIGRFFRDTEEMEAVKHLTEEIGAIFVKHHIDDRATQDDIIEKMYDNNTYSLAENQKLLHSVSEDCDTTELSEKIRKQTKNVELLELLKDIWGKGI